jgi:hypothetical protein
MRRYVALIVVAVLGAGTLAACGGDDDDSASASKTTISSNSSGATTTTTSDGGTDATTGNADFDALIAKAKTSSFRVTYNNTDGNSTFTFSQDPPKTAFLTGDGEQLIADGDSTIACDTTSGAPQCLKLPASEASTIDTLVQGFFGVASALVLGSSKGANGITFDSAKNSDETVAGRDAQCAEVTAAAVTGGGENRYKICVDKELGVMLLTETEGNGTTSRIEATEVGDPKSSDFDPPAEPTDVGALGSVPTQP